MAVPSERRLPSDQHPAFSQESHHTLSLVTPRIVEDIIFAKTELPNTLPQPTTHAEIARRHYMLNFVDQFPAARTAWERGGLTQHPETHNIIEHHVVSAIIGTVLAQDAGLPEKDVRQIGLAILVHDANKLAEIAGLRQALAETDPTQQRRRAAEVLADDSKALAGVVDAETRTLTHAIVPNSRRGWVDMRKQIIHLVDAIMDGSRLKTPEERMEAGKSTSSRNNSNSDLAGIRDTVHAEQIDLPHSEAYRELQIKLANKEAASIRELILAHHPEYAERLQSPQDLIHFAEERFLEEAWHFAEEKGLIQATES